MKVEMRDGKTLVVVPESTAEQVALQGFDKGTLGLETPQPFAPNVTSLKIEKKEA